MSATDAQAEANRRLALFGTGRALIRFTTTRKALNRELGEVIHVTYPRFGLDGGRLMTIAEIGVTLVDQNGIDTVEIVAYG